MYHLHCLLLVSLLLFTSIGYIDALDPSCLLLSGSQECQAFQDYAVNVSKVASATGPWIRNSTSVANLDKHLRSYVMQQQWWWQGNNDNFDNNLTNPLCGPDGVVFTARYSKTVLCAQLVRTSPGCNNNFNSTATLSLPTLCNATCAGFVNSITSCYTTNATLLGQQCPSSNKATCINGYDNEQLCGWTDDDGEGCTYCQAEPNDPCCATLYKNGTCSSFNTQQVVSAVLGSVFGCFLLLGCVWYYCWWSHRYKYHSPPWPFSRPFFSKIRKKLRPASSASSQQQLHNRPIPRPIPTKNDDTEKSTTTGDNDMKQMDNMISMHNTLSSTSTNNTAITKDEGPPTPTTTTTLSYTLAERHATGYCFYQAIYVNVPTRPDDITLEKGDIVYLHCYTNEDWGIGYNIATGQQGSFPMICICSLPLDQVWEWVNTHPMVKHRSLLKHRISYFISSQQHDDDDAEADDEHDTMTAETTTVATKKMKTKRTPTAKMMRRMTITPSSDDEDSPLTPPPPTLLHRALGKKSKSMGRSKKLWIGGGSSSLQQQQHLQYQQLYYQPLDSTLTLGYPTPLD